MVKEVTEQQIKANIQKSQSVKDIDDEKNKQQFYENIGQEPYIISKYLRPKGLTSQKLVKETTEDEQAYLQRKAVYRLEQDLKMQHDIVKNKNAALRGSMLKDEFSQAGLSNFR